MKILAYKKETLKQGLRRPIYSYKKDKKKNIYISAKENNFENDKNYLNKKVWNQNI